MSAQFLGSLTLGDTIPTGSVAIGAAVADLQAQITGALAAQAYLSIHPPSVAGNLQIAESIVAGLQISGPTVDFQVAAIAGLIAELQAKIAVLLSFQQLFGANVWMYLAEGPAGQIGGDLSAILPPPGVGAASPSAAVLIGASIPASRVALGAFFGVRVHV
jgi:hypothetical protein